MSTRSVGLLLRAMSRQVLETFRQAWASRLTLLMIVLTVCCTMFCASLSIEGEYELRDEPSNPELLSRSGAPYAPPSAEEVARQGGGYRSDRGTLVLGFGLLRVSLFRDGEAMVRYLLAVLALGVAGGLGTLIVLVWTSGFLPDFLQPSAISVLLSKPVPRWSLLVGKVAGVIAFATVQFALFLGATFVATGLSTRYWFTGYLWTLPVLMVNFTIFYGVSALLAVRTRNAILCVAGAALFWIVCLSVNTLRHSDVSAARPVGGEQPAAAAQSLAMPPNAGSWSTTRTQLLEAFYWVLPKPADLVILLDRMILAERDVGLPSALRDAAATGRWSAGWSLLTSLSFATLVTAAAAWKFHYTDY